MFTPRGIINLNSIGSLIWRLIDDNATGNDIIQKFSLLFPDIDLTLITNDVINFLTKLEKDEIIIINWDPLQPYSLEKSKRRC
ncbi:MAG: PqqD family protein [Ignavibacteriaceae bacterium]|nr:PqqD family protein [Ignavibacteriaceae bacterium]